MRLTCFLWGCAAALGCATANACQLPELAAVPDKIGGDVASVLLDVRRYSDAMVEYTRCLDAELTAAGGEAAPRDLRSTLVARNNYAVAEHKAVTDLYAERMGPLANLRLAEHLGGESKDCLLGSAIVGTGVVNDGAVLFFMRGGQAYLNVLEATCADLTREGSFFVGNPAGTGVGVSPASRNVIGPMGPAPVLETPLARRVCDHDDIFPYREGSGRRVFSCPLGRFFPLSEEDARGLLVVPTDATP